MSRAGRLHLTVICLLWPPTHVLMQPQQLQSAAAADDELGWHCSAVDVDYQATADSVASSQIDQPCPNQPFQYSLIAPNTHAGIGCTNIQAHFRE